MKKCKNLLIAAFAVLSLALICPNVLPYNGITKVEAAVKISKKKVILIKGQTKKLKITGTSKKVTWKSNKKAVATVNSKVKVTAKKKGTATITAKVGKKKYTCKVTVQNPSINKKTASVKVGNTVTLKMKGTNQKVTWKTSNKKIATVKSGKVTGKKAGTATITATVLNKKYTCKVTVKSASKNGVTYVTHKVDEGCDYKGILTIVKNNCSYNIQGTLTTVFYSSDGSKLKTFKDTIYCIEPGRESVLWSVAPATWNVSERIWLNYASYKTTLTTEASKYKSNVSGITWKASKGTNCINAKVKIANSQQTGKISVVFYKKGKVIGYDYRWLISYSANGSTETLSFDYPKDENNKYIIPDDYKINVDYFFTYK